LTTFLGPGLAVSLEVVDNTPVEASGKRVIIKSFLSWARQTQMRLSRFRRRCRLALVRALEVLRVEGVRSLWFKALGAVAYRRVVVMECPLDEAIVSVTTRIAVAVDLLRDGDVDEYVKFRPDTDPADIHERLLAGHQCFVARHEGRIVHACWAAIGRVWIDYLERELVLARDAVYHYDSFTMPAFRGHNISAFRVTEAARHFLTSGYGRLVAVVVPENRTAFRPLEKAGYRPVGTMGYIGRGRWRWHFSRTKRIPASRTAHPTW
jgi:GNAT superfamily N-acetyltransferase